MTWRRVVIDGPAAIVDGVAATIAWLDEQLLWGLTLVWYAYWIVVATGALLCFVADASGGSAGSGVRRQARGASARRMIRPCRV